MRPALLKRSSLLPFLVACAVGLLWINQGWESARVDAILHPPDGQQVGVVHETILNLYRRSGDEEIYFAVANAMRGLPYDHYRLSKRGRDTPAVFEHAPPEDGHWHRPYVEVPIEYPAAMLPFILLPSFVPGGKSLVVYTHAFSALMGLLLLAAAALAIRAQPGRSDRERWWWMAGMLLAQGSLSVGRLDAVLAFTLAWTLWAAAERKPGTMGFALGAATASKFLPALLAVPLVMADRPAWRQMSARWKAAIGFAIAVVVGFAPMFVPPDAFLGVLSYHSKRGLQVESSFGVLISTWRLITHTLVPATLSYGSFNHDGPVASFFAHMATPVTLLMMGGVAVVFARAAEPKDDIARRDRLALVLLAGVTALWLSAKVFSPQYLTWAMPLVLGVSGKRGRTLTWLLFLIYWITQYEMTGDYGNIMQQRPLGVLTLLVRLPLIVAFGVVAVRGLGRRSNERVAKSEPVVAGGGLAPSEANLE